MGENQTYFEVIFLGGKTIGFIIWAISIVTVALIVKYAIAIRRANILPEEVRDQIKGMFEEKKYRDVIDVTEQEPSFLSYIVNSALSDASHGYNAMERAMEEAAEERVTKMLRGIEWLNLIGNIGPMLGLLGTVWGMINVFFQIVEKGGMPNPSELAGGIGVALVTTMLGLAVAIPALSAYAILRNRIDAITSEAVMTSQELISTFRPGAKNA